MAQQLTNFSERLENLEKLSNLIKRNKNSLETSEVDSSLLAKSFAKFDIDALIHVFSNYSQLINLLDSKGYKMSERSGIKKAAIMLPYNGPGMTFALSFAGSYIYGVETDVKYASESKPFFSRLENLVSDSDLSNIFLNEDGSSIFSDLRGKEFLDKHLREETSTEVIEIYGHDSYITPNIESKLIKNPKVSLILEGPGKNRFIVANEPINYEECAEAMVELGTINSGQVCMGAEIFDVDQRAISKIIPYVIKAAAKKKVGDPYDPSTIVGPLQEGIANRVIRQVKDAVSKGAKIEFATPTLGSREKFYTDLNDLNTYNFIKHMRNGYVYVPIMVLSGIKSNMLIRTEETFGPIIPLRGFNELREIYNEIEDQSYGLGVHIFSKNLEDYKVLTDVLEKNNGHVFKNASMFSPGQFDILLSPWGGYKNSRFSIRGIKDKDNKNAVIKTQVGPSYTCLDFSKENGV